MANIASFPQRNRANTMPRFYLSGFIANIQALVGVIVGVCVCKPLGFRFGKEHRGQHFMFSHVSANMAAQGFYGFWQYPVFIARKNA